MTKRDFIEIARALHKLHTNACHEDARTQVVVDNAILTIRGVCQRSNPRFDVARFNRAVYDGLVSERPGTRERSI